MRRIEVIICLIVLSAIIVRAQDSTKNGLQDMKWALQFAEGSNLNLNAFQNGSVGISEVSFQKPFTLHSTLRIGLGILASGSSSAGQISSQSENVYLNSQYIYRPSIDNDIIIYYGTGPALSYIHRISNSSSQGSSSSPAYYSISNQYSWTAGLDATLGVEYFISHSISLSGEYYGTISYSWTNSYTNYNSNTPNLYEYKRTGFTTTSSLVRLGISAYFNW